MSAFLGLVQGITEFLPVSSSGHLALLQHFFNLGYSESENLFFTVLLHLGTLLAIFVYYWHDIVDMILEFFRGIAALFSKSSRGKSIPPARRLVFLIIVATLPLVLVLPVKDYVESLSGNIIFIGGALLTTGVILFVSDRLARGSKSEKTATVPDALLVGLAQAVAVVPGLSRSGCTIAAGMGRGYKRDFAVRFSFLMSLPAVLGANILDLTDAVKQGVDAAQVPVYAVGVIVAAVSGYFAIRLVSLLADKGKFGKFAYYCWTVGLIAVIAGIAGF